MSPAWNELPWLITRDYAKELFERMNPRATELKAAEDRAEAAEGRLDSVLKIANRGIEHYASGATSDHLVDYLRDIVSNARR